jgi:Putative quorum-sensing-regulated virulence factor
MSRARLLFSTLFFGIPRIPSHIRAVNPTRLSNIADLALHESTPDHEWQAAAIAFFRVLRNSKTPSEALLVSTEAPRKFRPEFSGSYSMPFGKFKDTPLAEIPDDYLEWLLSCEWLRDPLRSKVEAELDARS